MVDIFVDTSAILAIVNVGDINHEIAKTTWKDLVSGGAALVTNNYVIVESIALIQNRLGIRSVQKLSEELFPLVEIQWMGEEQHCEAVEHVIASNRRNLSLVDCSSFDTMRRLNIQTVFTFDPHFREQGFSVTP
jgi:predicted nucleic acid-binding protein